MRRDGVICGQRHFVLERLKKLLCFLPIVLLAACGASQTSSGVGFGDTSTRAEAVTVAQTSPGASTDSRTPVLRQTPTGAPWYDVASRSVRNGGAALQGFPALEVAQGYYSSRWSSPHAKQVSTPSGTGMFRLVTVDGNPFVVVRKNKAKSVWTTPKSELVGIADGAIAGAGCTRAGETLIRASIYSIQSTTTPVRCSWL